MNKIFSPENIDDRSEKGKENHRQDPEGFIPDFISDHIQ